MQWTAQSAYFTKVFWNIKIINSDWYTFARLFKIAILFSAVIGTLPWVIKTRVMRVSVVSSVSSLCSSNRLRFLAILLAHLVYLIIYICLNRNLFCLFLVFANCFVKKIFSFINRQISKQDECERRDFESLWRSFLQQCQSNKYHRRRRRKRINNWKSWSSSHSIVDWHFIRICPFGCCYCCPFSWRQHYVCNYLLYLPTHFGWLLARRKQQFVIFFATVLRKPTQMKSMMANRIGIISSLHLNTCKTHIKFS